MRFKVPVKYLSRTIASWLYHQRAALCHALAAFAPGILLVTWSIVGGSLLKIFVLGMFVVVTLYLAFVFPAVRRDPHLRRLAWHGYIAGLFATVVYTVFRWPPVHLGLIPDLPVLLGDQIMGVQDVYWDRTAWSVVAGYLIHLFLTGACWGSAFAVLGLWRSSAASILYGLVIGVIFLNTRLFSIALTYQMPVIPIWGIAALLLLAHVPYGWALGWGVRRFERLEPTPEGMSGLFGYGHTTEGADTAKNSVIAHPLSFRIGFEERRAKRK